MSRGIREDIALPSVWLLGEDIKVKGKEWFFNFTTLNIKGSNM